MSGLSDREVVEGLAERFRDQWFRLNHLYWIKGKSDKGDKLVRFRPNWAQESLYRGMHNRNEVLKGRQIGISTFMAIYLLDESLFSSNFMGGVIDAKTAAAKEKLAKMRLAWTYLDYVPPGAGPVERAVAAFGAALKARRGVKGKPVVDNKTEIGFSNGSKVSVDTSFRGGTLNVLHVSELAKISTERPIDAGEIVAGGFEAVPINGRIVVESTHEGGRKGENYALVKLAMESAGKAELSPLDWRFHFFSWVDHEEYQVPMREYRFKESTVEYFEELKVKYGVVCTEAQMAFWEGKEADKGYRVRQEYPTVPEEALEGIGELSVYGNVFARIRQEGRVGCRFVTDRYAPVYAVWDFGVADCTAVVFVQPLAGESRFLWGYQAHYMPLDHYFGVVRAFEEEQGVKVEAHLLPHDARNRNESLVSRVDHFRADPRMARAIVVPRCDDVTGSVNRVRTFLPSTRWHERCGDELPNGMLGVLACMENYHYKMRNSLVIDHDEYSHLADACRMYVEAAEAGLVAGYRSTFPGRASASGRAASPSRGIML